MQQQGLPAGQAAARQHAASPVSSAADDPENPVKPAPAGDASSHSSAAIDRLCAALEGFMRAAHRDEAVAAREAAKQGFRSTYTTLTIAAVLIVTITYGGLFSASNGQDTLFGGDYDAARALWWSNSLAFYFAIATLLLCSSEVLLTYTAAWSNSKAMLGLLICASCYMLAISATVAAYGSAGFIISSGQIRYIFAYHEKLAGHHVPEGAADDLGRLIDVEYGGHGFDAVVTVVLGTCLAVVLLAMHAFALWRFFNR